MPHRFAGKMKRRIVIFLATCTGICSGQSRTFIGTDLTSAICFKEVRVNSAYAFSEHWSADSDISINTGKISDCWSELETDHWKELYGGTDETSTFRDDFIDMSFSVSYWPQGAFSGLVICVGGSIKDRCGPDAIAGAGYFCRIWKGFRAGLTYRIRLAESIRKEHLPVEGIRICIGYVF